MHCCSARTLLGLPSRGPWRCPTCCRSLARRPSPRSLRPGPTPCAAHGTTRHGRPCGRRARRRPTRSSGTCATPAHHGRPWSGRPRSSALPSGRWRMPRGRACCVRIWARAPSCWATLCRCAAGMPRMHASAALCCQRCPRRIRWSMAILWLRTSRTGSTRTRRSSTGRLSRSRMSAPSLRARQSSPCSTACSCWRRRTLPLTAPCWTYRARTTRACMLSTA